MSDLLGSAQFYLPFTTLLFLFFHVFPIFILTTYSEVLIEENNRDFNHYYCYFSIRLNTSGQTK